MELYDKEGNSPPPSPRNGRPCGVENLSGIGNKYNEDERKCERTRHTRPPIVALNSEHGKKTFSRVVGKPGTYSLSEHEKEKKKKKKKL
jgi:hypothetical protein